MNNVYDWIENEQFVTDVHIETKIEEGNIGFVYLVTDIENNMKYIGKKLVITTKKLPPLKGKKRKRTKIVQTDWKDYFGSSEIIKNLVEEHGKERFKREILYWCKSKGELSYVEMYHQVKENVLLKPDEYYNGFVGGKIHRSHLKNVDLEEIVRL